MKQYSAACERNRDPILLVLRDVFRDTRNVLEIGSGSGQHAIHFGLHLPYLSWQTSDLSHNHESILAWQATAQLSNVFPPFTLDMASPIWPKVAHDAVFSANTCHIMTWQEVENMVAGVGKLLPLGGLFAVYGPFNYNNQFTSQSNANFDANLREFSPHMGLRDFEAMDALAKQANLLLEQDIAMPSNNRLLIWRKGN